MNTMTIRDLEAVVQAGLEALRAVKLNDDAESAKELLLPEGLTPVVELVHDNLRKKRSSAAAWNWNPTVDRIIISFRPSASQLSPSGAADSPEALAAAPECEVVDPVEPHIEPPSVAQSLPGVANEYSDRKESAIPLTGAQEVLECCQALAQAERSNRHFIALKWFRDELLSTVDYPWAKSPQGRQQVLTQAIAMGRIDLKKIHNPKMPEYPTTAVSLNRAVPIPGVTSRFHPIPIRGEAASATLLADRGAF